MLGNQIATFWVSGRRLADHLGIAFTTSIWWHMEGERPLRESRIRALIDQGEGLAPEPGCMGDELRTVLGHEERVAWLAQSRSDEWGPLVVSIGRQDPDGHAPIIMADGHHRLLATQIEDRRVAVNVTCGCRDALDALIVALDGEWGVRPETRLFGLGVFPAPGIAMDRYVDISCGPGKIWINDVDEGLSVARYGPKLWTVDRSPLGEGTDQMMEIRREGSNAEYRARFLAACETILGIDKEDLAGYCQAHLC